MIKNIPVEHTTVLSNMNVHAPVQFPSESLNFVVNRISTQQSGGYCSVEN